MADEGDMVGGEGAQGQRGPGVKGMRLMLVLALVVIVLVAYFRMSSTNKVEPKTETAEKKTEDKKEGKLDVTPVSDKGYAVEIDKRVTEIGQSVVRIAEEVKTFKTSVTEAIGGINNKVDQKYGELAGQMTAFTHEVQKAARENAAALGGGATLPSLSGVAAGVSGEMGTGAGGIGTVTPITYVNFGGLPAAPVAGSGRDLVDIGSGLTKDGKTKAHEAVDETERKLREAASRGAAAVVAPPSTKKVLVASASYVHVTTLHGVDCPTGSQSVPVILPVHGIIKGPNGETLDLGAAHFQGLCTGLENKVDGNESRARIKVTNLSFVAADGKPQFIKVEGYVVDRRDSSQDVKGIYETKQGEALAKSAAAAGVAAIGNLTASAEYTNITSGSTGTVASSLSGGSVAKAALGQAVGAAANRAAEFYMSKVEALTPIVHIEANLPLSFVSLAPFTVELPSEDAQQARLY